VQVTRRLEARRDRAAERVRSTLTGNPIKFAGHEHLGLEAWNSIRRTFARPLTLILTKYRFDGNQQWEQDFTQFPIREGH